MRMRWILAIGVLGLVLASVLAACGGGAKQEAAAQTLDGQALVEARCSVCHSLARVTLASKTRQGWQATVERMVGYGARLNKAEQKAVIDYLAKTYHP
jgi:competence protein ComEA